MAKFKIGDRVRVAFNAAKTDDRVPNQANGSAPGSGCYQTEHEFGVVSAERELPDGEVGYIVDIEIKSTRKRLISESKLEASE